MPKEPRAFPVLEENWPVLELFLACETQWRHASLSGMPTGIDYSCLPIVTSALGQTLSAERLAELREMECEALRVFAQRWKRK